jgi:hypothetical protein
VRVQKREDEDLAAQHVVTPVLVPGKSRPDPTGSQTAEDVRGDTGLALPEVEAAVGADVAALVAAVTDEPGKNRKERKALTYRKLAAARPAARALKLADRIANVESSVAADGKAGLLEMYRKEHPSSRAALHVAGEHDAQWARLDSLFGD